MAEKRNEEIDRFEAVSNNGKTYTIVVSQEFTIHTSRQGWFLKIPGPICKKTTEGDQVDDKGNNTFEILPSGILVKKKSS